MVLIISVPVHPGVGWASQAHLSVFTVQVRQYPMGEYDSKLDERGKLFPAPKHHRVNMDGYLRSYLYNPALYLLSVARARQMVEVHCGPEESQEAKVRKSFGGQKESTGKEVTGNTRDGQSNTQKVKTNRMV